ncbi:MAG: hypothetical protein EAX87_10900 [Candidatus Thorarchaeota archaeon]|nr:hypothetical protein [Candidatus Thorarchaeota archaeon]
MVFNQSTKRIVGIATALVLVGIIIVGFSIALNPPTSNIPDPPFLYSSLNDLFRYRNDTLGGAVTNYLEFELSFSNFQDGSAFLRLARAIITVWVADVTTHQPDATLMQYDPSSSLISCNPPRPRYQLFFSDNNATDGEWSATGTCTVILGTTELLESNSIVVYYGFMMSNNLARELDGHQFLVKIQADITYNAFYLGGILNFHYQDATYNWTLGEDVPIYMLPADST